jgi:homoserine O-succinyltransferase
MALLAFERLRRRTPRESEALTIGLVNNMPDAALKTTERQFRELLASAAGDTPIVLRIFSFPELPRSADGQRYVAEHHEPIADLWDGAFDGLIVTGAAPVAPRLEDEPCWPTLTRLVEWAERRTNSTIWSCLAAHAAVRHIDGIERRPLGAKLSGVFACEKIANHSLLALAPPNWTAPHSRYNELPEAALRARGYRILSRSPVAGADVFTKRCGSLFVFLQGHPEYDAGALGREYRRDVVNYVAGKSDRYPELPANYFSADVARQMLAFRDVVLREPGDALFERFPALPAMSAPWQGAAIGIFAGWLAQLDAKRSRRFGWLPQPMAPTRTLTPTYA